MAAASTLAVSRASAPCEGVVADEDGLGRAHGEGGAQAGDLAVGRHRDEGDLAPAGLVDELERHLDAVGVGLVEDELPVALRGCGRGSSAPGSAGSGICFTQTTMFMAADPASSRFRRAKLRRRYGPSRVRLLLLVNSSASSVTARGRVVIQKALSADHDVTRRRDQPARPRHPPGPGRGRDGVDVVVVLGGDGTLNEAANGLAGTDTALAALPGGSTNVFARTIGLPNDPIEATGALLDGLGRRAGSSTVGLGSVNGRYFLFHVGIGFDAAVVEQVERRAQLKR